MLAHAMLLTLRGVPTIYSGDEQGFVGDGNDQDAREDMFASKVAVYNDNRLLGTDHDHRDRPTSAPTNPLFRQIAELVAHPRARTPALTRGRQVLRARGDKPGLLAVSRFDPDDRRRKCCSRSTPRPRRSRPTCRSRPARRAFAALAGTLRRRVAARRAASRVDLCRRSAMRSAPPSERCRPHDRPRRAPTPRMVARRGDLPDLSAQLRRFERRRDRRPAGHHRASRSCRAAWASTRSGCRPSSPRRCTISATTSPIIATSIRSSARSPISTRWSRARTRWGCKVHHRPGLFAHLATSTPGSSKAAPTAPTPRPTGMSGPTPSPTAAPPNNWQSVFGGPAWTWDARRGQYYMHNFLTRAAAAQRASTRRCRTRCSTSRASGSIAASTASGSTRSTSRCTIPR